MAQDAGRSRKEPAVLRDSSLLILANGVGKHDLKGVELAMQLNIPTTTIVKYIGDITGASAMTLEDCENDRIILAYRCVLLWKEMTHQMKSRERVKMMESALRRVGRQDIADIFMDKFTNKEELTKDIFES